MNRTISSLLSRRDVLRAGIAGGVALALNAPAVRRPQKARRS